MTERKILKDEVQQDGKNANKSQPGIETGTPADAAGALPTELPGPGRNPTRTSDILTIRFYFPAPSDRHKLVRDFGLFRFLSGP